MLYFLVKLMKLYIPCQIDFFVDFQYQVYPKCSPSQCDDVNDMKLEYKNGDYNCLGLVAPGNFFVGAMTDESECVQWYYSCDQGHI